LRFSISPNVVPQGACRKETEAHRSVRRPYPTPLLYKFQLDDQLIFS
jgi:hypothetical protein